MKKLLLIFLLSQFALKAIIIQVVVFVDPKTKKQITLYGNIELGTDKKVSEEQLKYLQDLFEKNKDNTLSDLVVFYEGLPFGIFQSNTDLRKLDKLIQTDYSGILHQIYKLKSIQDNVLFNAENRWFHINKVTAETIVNLTNLKSKNLLDLNDKKTAEVINLIENSKISLNHIFQDIEKNVQELESYTLLPLDRELKGRIVSEIRNLKKAVESKDKELKKLLGQDNDKIYKLPISQVFSELNKQVTEKNNLLQQAIKADIFAIQIDKKVSEIINNIDQKKLTDIEFERLKTDNNFKDNHVTLLKELVTELEKSNNKWAAINKLISDLIVFDEALDINILYFLWKFESPNTVIFIDASHIDNLKNNLLKLGYKLTYDSEIETIDNKKIKKHSEIIEKFNQRTEKETKKTQENIAAGKKFTIDEIKKIESEQNSEFKPLKNNYFDLMMYPYEKHALITQKSPAH